MPEFYSNGKLLLTGEYLVLDGAKALALPIKYGQKLSVKISSDPELKWNSYDANGKIWFSCVFSLSDLSFTQETDLKTARTLQNILRTTRELNPDFLRSSQGFICESFLNFPREWGLGTSSTLINNIAQWAQVNAFTLLYKSFGGSGYDVACAQHDVPVLFQMQKDKPFVEEINFSPEFKDKLFFVYLNKKQNSGSEIKKYRGVNKNLTSAVKTINQLAHEMISCENLTDFEKILAEHESIIASVINKTPVQRELFPDYFGQMKSLGAWGGDFILATGNEQTPGYFKEKGFDTVIPFNEMVLK